MIIDRETMVSDRQAISGVAYSIESLDLGQALPANNDDFGLLLVVRSLTGTLVATIEHSDDNTNWSTLLALRVTAPEPNAQALRVAKRYLRVRYDATAANVTAWFGMVDQIPVWRALPDAL